MYEIAKNVIHSKKYELSSMLVKIDTLWVQGDLSDEQRDELVNLARTNANTSNSLDIVRKLEDLDKRVKALEEGNTDDDEAEATGGYAEYVVGKWYYNGDKITFDGKKYNCIAPQETVCTWSPAEYPPYWEETA